MRKILFLAVVLLLVLCALPFLLADGKPRPYQGWVEADTLFIGTENGGRLTELAVAEGQAVTIDTPLFRLDDRTEAAAVDSARAELAKAQAQQALVMAAQKRPEEIAVLAASERETQAKLDLASEELERTTALFNRGTASKSNLDSAEANYAASKAALDNIRRQIDLGRLPEREETIRAADETMRSAQANLAAAEAALTRRAVHAPATGTVEELYYRSGEVVPAGRPVVAILPPENIKLRFFIPQAALAGTRLGDRLTISCDGCETSAARITFIAASAEYTPPEIYTPEERAKLVYRIEAMPEKPALLRVGQPVDILPAAGSGEAQ